MELMMLIRTRAVLVLLSLVMFALAACGDDSTQERPSRNDASITDSGADADVQDGGQDAADSSDAVADAGDTGRDADTSTESCEPTSPFRTEAIFPTDVYVSPSGDDANTGRQDAPFATLEHAASGAVPGARIHLMAGTYAGGIHIAELQGTADNPITITGEEGTIIDGGNTGLQLSDPEYLVVENLTIQNTAQNGLNIDDAGSFDTPAHHIVLRNITVENVGSGGNEDCIKMSGVDDFWVLDSDVSACTGQGIDMVGCHDGVISQNHIHDKPNSGIQAKGGTSDILIHGNRFTEVTGRGVNAGGSTGLAFFRPQDAAFEGARIRVVANIFEEVGAESGAPIAFVGCDACVFANNTVIEPKTWVARILQETTGERFVPSRDGLFVNNIVMFNVADLRNGVFVNVGPNTAPETFTFANNLWFAMDDASFSGPTLSGGIPAAQDSIVQQDPAFNDQAGGDYHIEATSPAANRGQEVPGAAFADFDDVCFEEPPSVGAFEAVD
jgi:hypothetical protein